MYDILPARRDNKDINEKEYACSVRDFYCGELGRTIGDYVQANGGALTRRDMADFEPRLTEPYQITYRDVPMYGPILPNGCLSALQILHMLECFPVVPDDQALYWHQLAEVVKQAWRDRLRYVGDVPVEHLLQSRRSPGAIPRAGQSASVGSLSSGRRRNLARIGCGRRGQSPKAGPSVPASPCRTRALFWATACAVWTPAPVEPILWLRASVRSKASKVRTGGNGWAAVFTHVMGI